MPTQISKLKLKKHKSFLAMLRALWSGQEGVTAIEYSLIAGLIAVVIVGSVTALGTQIASTFATISSALN